jgi:hypothetical protein
LSEECKAVDHDSARAAWVAGFGERIVRLGLTVMALDFCTGGVFVFLVFYLIERSVFLE